jgi:hypothetical protein
VTVLVSRYNDQPVVAKVVKVAADLRVALPTAVAARVERLRALAEVRGRS